MNSDEIVNKIQKYGTVTVSQFEDSKFCASIELKVTGMDAKVRTGFDHPTMNSALQELDQKLSSVIIKIGSISKEQALLTN